MNTTFTEEQGFNEAQLDVINRGLDLGIDASSFAKPELDWTVMLEALKAIQEGIDLTDYLANFDHFQLDIIREGLKEGYDPSIFANPAHSHWEMEQLLEGLRSGVDVTKFSDVRFHHDQMKFIRLQLEKGKDVEAFANPDYKEPRMEQIALAQEQGLDLKYLLNPALNEDQMHVIRLGLRDGIDVSIFAKSEYSAQQMDVLRGAILNGEDVSEVLDSTLGAYQMHHMLKAKRYGYNMSRGFSSPEMREITLGLERDLDVSVYAQLDENNRSVFDLRQMYQIRNGMLLNLDPTDFAKPEYSAIKMSKMIKDLVRVKYSEYFEMFNEQQLKTIFDGIMAGIDYKLYTKSDYDAEQMREIFIGLMAGLDVTLYAKPDYDAYQMRVIRRGIIKGLDVSSYLDPNLTSDEMYDIFENLCKMKAD